MIENNRFKIKTTEGYKDFVGIAESSHDSYLEISFSNGEIIKCSGEHVFWTYNNNLIKAKDLLVGFDLKSENGIFEVSEINEIETQTNMFDIIEVGSSDNNFVLSNSLKTHNCQFITFERSLIDTDVLDFYQTSETIEEINGFNLYKEKMEHVDGWLIITVDPSAGGEDSSVIQVWEIAPNKIYELASFVDEYADATVIFDNILWLQKFMKHQWQYEPEESLIIFERNGIGEGLSQILTRTEKAIEELETPIYYDNKNNPGIHITQTLKNKLALQFKNLVEFDKMKINDSQLITELYGFVRTSNGSYSGKSGYHDDRIMAAFLMVYYVYNVYVDYADGDFSVDNLMLVNADEKLKKPNREELDPAALYRERVEKDDLALIEAAKKAEREAYAKQAQMGSSIVEEDSDDDDIDLDQYDILSSQSL